MAKVAEAKAEAIAAVYMIPVFFLGLIPKAGEAIVAVVVFVAQVVVFVVKGAVALIPQWTIGVLILFFSLAYLAHGIQALDEGTAVPLHKSGIPLFADWGQYQETRRLTLAHLFGFVMFVLATLALEVMVHLAGRTRPADVWAMIAWSAGSAVVVADVALFALGCHALGGTWFKAALFTVGYLAGMVLIALFSNFLIALLFHRRNDT